MIEILLWTALGLIVYAYAGFPLLLMLRAAVRRPVRKADLTPTVSLVICAYNEAGTIAEKLDNVLALDYPRERLQVLVGSDGSTDGTNEIVAHYAGHGVELIAFPRSGKMPVLNALVARATGEILVFSDANSIYDRDALRQLVRSFADPAVGGVAGNQVYSTSSGNAASFGERLYWRLDRWLKRLESRAGSTISATGAIYAIRRELFRPVPAAVSDDLVISTRVIAQGRRLVFEPAAIAREATAPDDGAEFRRKVRVVNHSLRALWTMRELFNPLRYGFYSLELFSHKVLRRSVIWLLLVVLPASVWLAPTGPVYRALLLAQLALYGAAALALLLRSTSVRRWKLYRLLAVPYYFCFVNLACLRAWLQLARGHRFETWDSGRIALTDSTDAPHPSVPSHAATAAKT
jgi:cellulose synthase/poly-beta-1,6-N-acetylglucosamine synthase-like glycosyltransferase